MRIEISKCPRCAANDWPYAANGGVERCDCPRGRELAQMDTNYGRRRTDVPGVEPELAALAVEELAALIPHYGALGTDVARLAVARALRAFICDAEELAWLVRELPLRYAAWPAIGEVRALYCAMFSPRDGIVATSNVYPDGIPGLSEPHHLIADSPRGGMISASVAEAEVVRDLASSKTIEAPAWSLPPAKRPQRPPVVLPTEEEIERVKEQQARNRKDGGGVL